MILHNNELLDLLKDANIRVPLFKGPKLLSCVVTIHKVSGDSTTGTNIPKENNVNKLNTTQKKISGKRNKTTTKSHVKEKDENKVEVQVVAANQKKCEKAVTKISEQKENVDAIVSKTVQNELKETQTSTKIESACSTKPEKPINAIDSDDSTQQSSPKTTNPSKNCIFF